MREERIKELASALCDGECTEQEIKEILLTGDEKLIEQFLYHYRSYMCLGHMMRNEENNTVHKKVMAIIQETEIFRGNIPLFFSDLDDSL